MTQDVELRSLIGRVRRRWFALVALRTTARSAAAAAIPACAALVLNSVFALSGVPLLLLTALTLIASLTLAARVVWRVQRRPDDCHVARFIEERTARMPGVSPMDDALVSAVCLSEIQLAERPRFASQIVEQALVRMRALGPATVIEPRAFRRAGLQAAVGCGVLAAVIVVGSPALTRALNTARISLLPGSIRLEVLPGDTRVVAGEPLRIRAVVHGLDLSGTGLTANLTVIGGDDQRVVPMTAANGGFEFGFESVDRTFRYEVSAGRASSQQFTVTAVFAPRVRRIDVQYRYPAFTGLKPRNQEDGGDIYAPAGTHVRLAIHTSKVVSAGSLALRRGSGVGLRGTGTRVLEADLVLSADDSYRVQLTDGDGLQSSNDSEYFIRVMDDRPPDVRILRPAADQHITPLEEVSIEARADDDYGIARFELVYSAAGGPERTVPFTRTSGTDVARIGSHMLAAEALGVQPGDVIAYYARARDVSRGKRSTETKSDIFFLEVKPFNEEFVAAQSQAQGGAAGAQVEALIAAQKEIINATWNLERRSAAGRSAADVKSVAQAQAELKARAEQMTSRGRARAPGGVPQQVAPRRQPAPSRQAGVTAAIEAMTQALQQLEAARTRDAIPHEMAALRGLLQAQAEVRRTQVTQQQGAAGNGGSSRQGQDLSALFDRELQRQQRTNYEMRSQIEERPDAQKNDRALDRIRDLARRQEELSRRQRELADGGVSAEELRRRLEKLTREQTELREEAESLARQMQAGPRERASQGDQTRSGGQQQSQQGGATPRGGAQPSRPGGDNGGAEMRDAAEQMRNATSELRRQDADAAADRSQRAAEQLRRAEQQLRDARDGGGARAAGDLQLEAQQITSAQRRIAAEAERLGKERSGSGGEARRRLAAEKDRLADRVDELQRSAQRMAQGGSAGGPPNAAAQAARDLERQGVSREMRDSAKRMRGSAGAAGTERGGPAEPETERRIAGMVDKVAETLGGAGTADARRLADQLAQSQEIRDRLNRLEQQMRDAEARERSASKPGPSARPSSEGREGKEGNDVQRLREEYGRELQRSREALDRLTQSEPRDGLGGSTPEQHEFSRSAPGNEAFKQDKTGWESLRKDVDLALEKYDAAVSARLARRLAEDRLSLGGSERVPDSYERLIARYYESLAKVKK